MNSSNAESPNYTWKAIPRLAECTVQPTSEPLDLSEAKRHLNLADVVSVHDQYVSDLIQAARQQFEYDAQYACFTSTWREKFDGWPVDEIQLAKRPIQSVSSITYVDEAGSSQTWSSSKYAFDSARVLPAVWLAWNETWPTVRGDRNGITITYIAGNATVAAIPRIVKQAILLKVGEMFAERMPGDVRKQDMQTAYGSIVRQFMRSSYP